MDEIEPTPLETFTIRAVRACRSSGSMAFVTATTPKTLASKTARSVAVTPPKDLAVRLRTLTAPVLVIAGAEDCLTGLAPVMAFATRFPAGLVEVIERCGHYPWLEQPAALRRAVDAYLDKLE